MVAIILASAIDAIAGISCGSGEKRPASAVKSNSNSRSYLVRRQRHAAPKAAAALDERMAVFAHSKPKSGQSPKSNIAAEEGKRLRSSSVDSISPAWLEYPSRSALCVEPWPYSQAWSSLRQVGDQGRFFLARPRRISA